MAYDKTEAEIVWGIRARGVPDHAWHSLGPIRFAAPSVKRSIWNLAVQFPCIRPSRACGHQVGMVATVVSRRFQEFLQQFGLTFEICLAGKEIGAPRTMSPLLFAEFRIDKQTGKYLCRFFVRMVSQGR